MISLNWVKDYIDLENEDLKKLAVKITSSGVNIEKVVDSHIDNLVIGEIKEVVKHPDSDHLNICKVDLKDTEEQIVCGAPNVRQGLKVIVAKPGCILPGNNEIKKDKIRGIESNGMICALFELGLEEKTEENYNKGIHEVASDIEVGLDANIYLGLDDCLYELDVHKHRNNDCYYHIGFAYEIGCILNKKVTLPQISYNEIPEKINMNLNVQTDKCSYYLGKMVKNITIKESPEFIKKRLIAAGMRPINNVVDISNYVMLEFGQPMHFFDADKLGDSIIVRNAKDGEKLTTLDNNERILKNTDIVICDKEKPVCLAGVMGGVNTEVDENTKNIFIESAIFSSSSIRNTSNRLNLRSEASIRYGKGLSYEYTNLALKRACEFLEKYANGTVLSGEIKYDNVDKTPKVVEFTAEDINKILGINLNNEDIKTELERLDFDYKFNKKFIVTIPTRRLDIDPNVNDIAEEIGRLYGYHNLVNTLPISSLRKGEYKDDVRLRKTVTKRLRALSLNETKTYTLTSPDMAKLFKYDNKENLVLPNPMSIDKSVIRTTLLPSLLNVYEYNKARHVKDILIYEISKVYDKHYNEEIKIAILMKGNYIINNWQNNNLKVDFYVLKGIIENLLTYLGFKNRYTFIKEEIDSMHPGVCAGIYIDRKRVGVIGKIHPSIKKDEIFVSELSLSEIDKLPIKPIKYKESSKYPEIEKDMAFVVDKNIDSESIKNVIKKNGKRILDSIEVFDLYENYSDTKKSIAYKLIFKENTRTLSQDEVMEVFNDIIDKVCKEFNCTLRDK